MKTDTESTWPCGQPGVLELGLRLHFKQVVCALIPGGPLDPKSDIDVGAGAGCVIIELNQRPSMSQMKALKNACLHHTPEGYTAYIVEAFRDCAR